MIELALSQTSEKIIVTLNELITLNEPYYLFQFTHVTTKDVISFVKSQGSDESDYPDRYNQFDINTSVVFANKLPGEWHYEIYEQTSDTNTDVTNATSLLEMGKMLLKGSEFNYTMYDNAVSFKAYNG